MAIEPKGPERRNPKIEDSGPETSAKAYLQNPSHSGKPPTVFRPTDRQASTGQVSGLSSHFFHPGRNARVPQHGPPKWAITHFGYRDMGIARVFTVGTATWAIAHFGLLGQISFRRVVAPGGRVLAARQDEVARITFINSDLRALVPHARVAKASIRVLCGLVTELPACFRTTR